MPSYRPRNELICIDHASRDHVNMTHTLYSPPERELLFLSGVSVAFTRKS